MMLKESHDRQSNTMTTTNKHEISKGEEAKAKSKEEKKAKDATSIIINIRYKIPRVHKTLPPKVVS